MGKAFAIIFVILLVVMSLGVLFTEEPIETPANEIILSESDFEGNWTSWWVVLELEGPPDVDPANFSQVRVEHYNNYPIRPQDRDLQATISVSVNASISDAVNFLDLYEGILYEGILDLGGGYSIPVNVTAYDIGDEGFLLETDDWFFFVFRVKNVIVWIHFYEQADLDPSSILVQELIDLQVSKIAQL